LISDLFQFSNLLIYNYIQGIAGDSQPFTVIIFTARSLAAGYLVVRRVGFRHFMWW